MSAQQQLAALVKNIVARGEGCNGQLWTIQAATFLRDHGPAISELIEAADHLGGAQRDLTAYHENATPGTFNSYKADAFEKARDEWLVKLATALRKLTQDA